MLNKQDVALSTRVSLSHAARGLSIGYLCHARRHTLAKLDAALTNDSENTKICASKSQPQGTWLPTAPDMGALRNSKAPRSSLNLQKRSPARYGKLTPSEKKKTVSVRHRLHCRQLRWHYLTVRRQAHAHDKYCIQFSEID